CTTGSVAFDRAAAFYDRTRGFPPGVDREVARGICRLAGLRPGERLLELGIGTGRLALPLQEVGLSVWGIDLSRPMLEVLCSKPGGRGIALVEGHIRALPFLAAQFDAALAVHVLHLVAPWRDALREAARVLKPSGAFLLGWGGHADPETPLGKVRERWRAAVVARGGSVDRPGEHDPRRVIAALERLGFLVECEADIARWTTSTSVAEVLRTIEERVFSDAWSVPEEIHRAALDEVRGWVLESGFDLGRPLEQTHTLHLAVLRRSDRGASAATRADR
ncbi:MAG: class I SAM-dependent methyltransferase, partial [Chloroflexia bacterium]